MTDPYRLTDQPQSRPRSSPTDPRTEVGRTLLWLLLAVSAAANSVASLADVPIAIHLGLGAITALCASALIIQYRRGLN